MIFLECFRVDQGKGISSTYVNPVDRLMPARNAETVGRLSADVLSVKGSGEAGEGRRRGGHTQYSIKCIVSKSSELSP